MKSILKLCAFFVYVLCASLTNSADIARSEAPQIQVKKKSLFKKNAPSSYFAKSATNKLTGETLAVWKEEVWKDFTFLGIKVTGTILNPQGKGTAKKLPPIPPQGGMGNLTFGVAHNPVTNEFLIVQSRWGSIVVQRFDAKAKGIGKEFEIIPATLASTNQHPHVIFNPHTDGYSLVWERTEGVSATLLDRSGKLAGSLVTLKKNPDAGFYDDWGNGAPGAYPRIHGFAFLPSGNKVLVVFQQRFSPTKGDYWLATLDPALKNVSDKNLSKINQKTVDFTKDSFWIAPRWGWGAILTTLQDGSAVVYFADEKRVNRRKIDVNGKPTSKAGPAFSGALKNAHLYDPEVAFSTISTGTIGLLIATEQKPQKEKIIWAQTLSAKGHPTGEPVVLDAAEPNTFLFTSELMALPRTQSDTLLQYIYLQSENYCTYPRPFEEECTNKFQRLDLEVQP